MEKHYSRTIKGLVFVALVALWGCSEKTPEETALAFAKTGDYQLLSEKDKAVISESDFDWGVVTDPMLEPTSKYYSLEKHLLGMVTYRVGQVQTEPGKTEVEIIATLPRVAKDVLLWRAETFSNDEEVERAENLLSYHERAGVTQEDLEFVEHKQVFVVLEDGVFVDAGSRLEIEELNAKVRQHIERFNGLGALAFRVKHDRSGLDELRAQTEGLEQALAELLKVRDSLKELQGVNPDLVEGTLSIVDSQLEDIEDAMALLEQRK